MKNYKDILLEILDDKLVILDDYNKEKDTILDQYAKAIKFLDIKSIAKNDNYVEPLVPIAATNQLINMDDI